MVNVLHVLSDTNIGGAGMHLLSLVKGIDRNKFRLFVVCPKGAAIVKYMDSGVKVIEAPFMDGDKSFDPAAILGLISVIKEYRIEIVHTHASLSGRIAAKLAGAKIVYTRHTPSEVFPKFSSKWLANKYLNLFLSNKVIAVSDYIANQLVESGISKRKIVTIRNGIDIAKYQHPVDAQQVRSVYNLKDEFLLCQVGRLEDEKGHRYLFEALSTIDFSRCNLKLFVVGDGSKRDELKALAERLGIKDRVIFTGFLKDTRHVVSISNVVMLPSLKEAMAIALLEGMVMGKPAIASNTGGIPEVVQNGVNGILVAPRDVQGIAKAIIQLYEDADLRFEMGHAAKKTVEESFNIADSIRRLEELYFDIIS